MSQEKEATNILATYFNTTPSPENLFNDRVQILEGNNHVPKLETTCFDTIMESTCPHYISLNDMSKSPTPKIFEKLVTQMETYDELPYLEKLTFNMLNRMLSSTRNNIEENKQRNFPPNTFNQDYVKTENHVKYYRYYPSDWKDTEYEDRGIVVKESDFLNEQYIREVVMPEYESIRSEVENDIAFDNRVQDWIETDEYAEMMQNVLEP